MAKVLYTAEAQVTGAETATVVRATVRWSRTATAPGDGRVGRRDQSRTALRRRLRRLLRERPGRRGPAAAPGGRCGHHRRLGRVAAHRRRGFRLTVTLDVALPAVSERETAAALVGSPRGLSLFQRHPGNIDVELLLEGRPL